jgi:hypothetical protein
MEQDMVIDRHLMGKATRACALQDRFSDGRHQH